MPWEEVVVEVLLASPYREERWGAGGPRHLFWSAASLGWVGEQPEPLLVVACSWGSGVRKVVSVGLQG